uniref:Secreted protein n=1 Tax=Raphanus sativus TaxID=3726 RepID=A0A650GAH7_RAPSA|nr:hypothetical protein [Raphanus sativus]QGW48689.1 hypothetical protein [Raphanus sativus]
MVLIFLFLMSVQQLLLPQKVEYQLVMFFLFLLKKNPCSQSLNFPLGPKPCSVLDCQLLEQTPDTFQERARAAGKEKSD